MRDRVYLVVSQVFGVPLETITDESSPDSIVAWDSLKHLNLVMTLEEEFGIQLTQTQILEMLTVGLIVEVLKETGAAGAKAS